MAGYTILLVDDDPTMHLIMGKYLEMSGYNVIHAEDGGQGLKLIKERQPDLVLMDIEMPGMDGFKVLDTIKKTEFRDIPILFVSALEHQHLKVKGLKQGADDYITKPIDKAEFLARVMAVLRRTERYRRVEGMMEGNLSDVGLSDLLQNMEFGSKTASMFLKDIDGEIYVENGFLIHARQGGFTGEQAITRIFLLEKGSFSIKFNELPEDISGQPKPLMSVLMNAANEVDEIKDAISRMHVENHLVKINGDVSEFPDIGKLRKHPQLTFTDMVVLMEGNPRDNLSTLVKASKKGKLKLVK